MRLPSKALLIITSLIMQKTTVVFGKNIINGSERQIINIPQTQQKYKKLVDAISSRDVNKIVTLVEYPLVRRYPLRPIRHEDDLKERFDEIFDEKLINKFTILDLNKDICQVGWRGEMIWDGEVWLTEEGKISTLNYSSIKEINRRKREIEHIRKGLHPSLRKFKEPILQLMSTSIVLRIDKTENEKYRLAINKYDFKNVPKVVVESGTLDFEGTGGNHFFTFKSGEIERIVYVNVISETNNTGKLVIKKNNKVVEQYELW